MTKEIPLTQGKVALVDDEDYEWLNQWTWNAVKDDSTFYAARLDYSVRPRRRIAMHRLILGLNKPGEGRGDHADGNGLNNQRYNLRRATARQNAANQKKRAGCSSKFKGVSWDKARQKWVANTCFNYQNFHLGTFESEVEAAIAYDRAAIEKHGVFAKTNFGPA